MSNLLNRDQFGPAQSRRMWHLTDNPDFALDPEFEPQDNTFAIHSRQGARGLYMTDNPGRWVNGHDYRRPFAVELEVPETAMHAERWGGEMFMPSENFGQAKVSRVIPTDAHVREEYGGHGWFEDRAGRTFDTDEEIPEVPWNSPVSAHYPYKGYRYPGPDVRSMGEEQRRRIISMTQESE